MVSEEGGMLGKLKELKFLNRKTLFPKKGKGF